MEDEEFQHFLKTFAERCGALDGANKADAPKHFNRLPAQSAEQSAQLQESQDDVTPGMCHFCEQVFASVAELRKHFDDNIVDDKHICQVCSASFRYPSKFQRHYRRHTSTKPYGCGVCGREFAQPENLHRHMRAHTKERSFICDACEVRFARKDNLKTHIRKRHAEAREADTGESKKKLCRNECVLRDVALETSALSVVP
ncbi:hypothetical protein MRX96_014978 [Rhipicephalus microplus]